MQPNNHANSPFKGFSRVSKSKRHHPDRLKILLWGSYYKQRIPSIRLLLNIDKNLQMRKRGRDWMGRIEIWCPTRTDAKNLQERLVREASKKQGHISLGKSLRERKRTENQNQILTKEKYSIQKTVTVLHWNARSLNRKTDELKKYMAEVDAKIVCIQESSLSKTTQYHPKFKNFRMLNLSRDIGRGGGLVTLIHNSIHVEDYTMKSETHMEYIKTNVRLDKNSSCTIFNVYIPSQGIRTQDLTPITPDMRKCLIMGDFNSRHNSWNEGDENGNGRVLFDWIQNEDLILLNQNKTPTYQSASHHTLSTLDLAIATPAMESSIADWRVGEDLGSDHFPVTFDIKLNQKKVKNTNIIRGKYNVNKADWEGFYKATENCNSDKFDLATIESDLQTAADQCIPKKKLRREQLHLNNWWNENLTKLRKERQRARRKWKKKRTITCRQRYNKLNAELQKSILEAKRTAWTDFVSTINDNTPSSTVWKKFHAIQGKTNSKICQLKTPSGTWLEEDDEKAEAFNTFYSSKAGKAVSWPRMLTCKEMELSATFKLQFLADDNMNTPFTMNELREGISKLKSAAPGQDEIYNDMLKNCSPMLIDKILNLFNSIWNSGNIPQDWKTSIIVPLPKPGKDPTSVTSYRPIALTSCLGKLMERLVNNRLNHKLETLNLLNNNQFGFRRKRSTNDALLYLTNKIFNGFKQRKSTIAVLLDFEAAFDKTPHKSVLLQSMKLGIKGKTLQYLSNFLHDREIKTVVDGTMSKPAKLENGIIQGSSISPTLFNIAIHDLCSELPEGTDGVIFADDVTIFATAESPDEACNLLQRALDNIMKWCEKWSLAISLTKTECVFFTRRITLKNYQPHLFINNQVLKVNDCPKLLGVYLDQKLLFNKHVEEVKNQCSRRLNALKAVANKNWGADTSSLKMFYTSFVRSKMLYCAEVWGGTADTHIKKLQRIQSAALRLVLGCPSTSPIAAMEIECHIEPVDLMIKKLIMSKWIKIQSLPAGHPLIALTTTKTRQSFTFQTEALKDLLGPMKPEIIPVVSEVLPWQESEFSSNTRLPSGNTKTNTEDLEALRAEAMDLIEREYKDHVKIYTDGSVDLPDNRSGAGFFNDNTGECYYIPANSASSMDAEILAINAALASCANTHERKVCILTDSKSAIESLRSLSPGDYFFRIGETKSLINELTKSGKNITFQWIPSHCGINGNEIADHIAKDATKMGPVMPVQLSLKKCMNLVAKIITDQWTERWSAGTVGRSLFSIQKRPAPKDWYRGVKRHIATFIARARMGHAVTNSYLKRFRLVDSEQCEKCGLHEETLRHILLECSSENRARATLIKELKGCKQGNELECVLQNREYWALAAAIYHGHRVVGVT